MAMQITQGNTTFIDYFPVHFMGDVTPIKGVFNSVAMVCNAGFVQTAVGIAVAISITLMVFNFIRAKIGFQGMAINIILSLLIVLGFFVKAQVSIIDSRTKLGASVVGALGRAEVANVPYPLALISSLGSFLSFELVRAIEPAITLDVDAPTYTEFGFMKHLHYTFSKTQIDVSNPAVVNWIGSYKNYIIDCVRPYGDDYDLKMLSENVSLDIINPKKMNSTIAKNTPDLMKTQKGRKCQDVYNELSANFKNNGIADTIRDALRRGIGASNNAVYANIANKASYLYQGVTDNSTGFDAYTNFLLRPMLQTNATNAKVASSIGVGGGITGSSAIANAEAFLSKARVDGASLSSWLVWNEWVDTALNIIVMLSYIIFPFVAMIALATPLETKISMAKNYFGGVLVVNLYPLGLAIIHSICIYFLHKNVGDMLMGVGDTSPIYNAEYYKEIADYATISTILGSLFGITLPVVIYTGAIGKLMGALSRIASTQAGDVGSYMRESTNAQALNMVAQDVGSSVGSMERVSMVSGAIGASATKLGDWSQMEGEGANQGRSRFLEAVKEADKANALSSNLSNSESLSYVASGGFEGAKQAGMGAVMGNTMLNGHSWTDTDGTHSISGSAIAKGTGSMAGAGAVASGIAGAESRIIDSSGGLGGREGSDYNQGLINSQRVQQNQTIGLGKEGTLTLGEMANIQRLSASSFQGQVAQGEALKREYGTGGSNPMLGDGYKKDMITSSQDKWKQAKAMSSKLREMFGENLDGEYGGKTRDEVLEGNTDMKLKGEVGSAIGYDKAKKFAKEKGLTDNPDDIAMASSSIQTQAGLLSASKKIKNEKDKFLSDAIEENRSQIAKDAISSNANDKIARANSKAEYWGNQIASLQNKLQEARKEYLNTAMNSVDGFADDSKIQAIENQIKDAMGRKQAWEELALQGGYNYAKQFDANVKGMSDSEAIFNIADKVSSMDAYSYSLSSAQFAGTQAMGVANSTGGLTSAGYEGARIAGMERAKGLLDNVATFGNAQSMDTFARDVGLSLGQRDALANAGSASERAKLLSLMTLGRNISGFVGDKSFNVGFGGAGTTTSYMGSINSQISRSMGFTANAGNGFSAMAYGAGGMGAMEGMAVASTAYSTASSIAKAVSQVGRIGGGAMDMARGFMGGGGGSVLPATEYGVAMSNVNAVSSMSSKGVNTAIRTLSVESRFGNGLKMREVPDYVKNNMSMLNTAKSSAKSSGGASSGGSVVGGSGLPPL